MAPTCLIPAIPLGLCLTRDQSSVGGYKSFTPRKTAGQNTNSQTNQSESLGGCSGWKVASTIHQLKATAAGAVCLTATHFISHLIYLNNCIRKRLKPSVWSNDLPRLTSVEPATGACLVSEEHAICYTFTRLH